MNVLILIWVAHVVLCAILSGTIAGAKGRDSVAYFIGGLLFGLFGLILAAGMPTREAERLEKKRDSEAKERDRLNRERIAQEKMQAKFDKKQARLERKQAKAGKP